MSISSVVISSKNTVAQVFTTSTLTAVTDLSESLTAPFGYWFKFAISYSVGASSGFPQVGLSFPVSPTAFAAHVRFTGIATGATTGDSQGDITQNATSVALTGTITSGINLLGLVEGTIQPSIDGTLQLRFAKPVSGPTDVTINAYSTLIMRRIF